MSLVYVLPIGLLLGSLYAVSFVTQQRRLFLYPTPKKSSSLILIPIRIMLIALFSYYLLHLPSTGHILIATLAFLAGFWLIILSKRALIHERS